MTNKHAVPGTEVPCPNENISVPYGIIKTVSHYLGEVGALDAVSALKSRGVPMAPLVVAMCSCALMGSNSMSKCAEWLEDPHVRAELGIHAEVGQKTLNRALEALGGGARQVIGAMWEGIRARYGLAGGQDVAVDGSAVVFNGPMSEMGALGYPRDHRDPGRPQVEFVAAHLRESGIPFYIEAYPGNAPDAAQYRDSLPRILEMVGEGSRVIMDAGGSSADVLDAVVGAGCGYLTRKRMNKSDDERMARGGWEEVSEGVECIGHVFRDSGRAVYLFRTGAGVAAAEAAARRNAERNLAAAEAVAEAMGAGRRLRISDYAKVYKNGLVDVRVIVGLQTTLDMWSGDPEGYARSLMGPRAGVFKLESSCHLPPAEALSAYRSRAGVERLIHSFKRVTGLKPLRVWKESSTRGSMLLALLAEAAMAMARYDAETAAAAEAAEAPPAMPKGARAATETMVWALRHLTLCRVVEGGRAKGAVYCGWSPLSRLVMGRIRADMAARRASGAG